MPDRIINMFGGRVGTRSFVLVNFVEVVGGKAKYIT